MAMTETSDGDLTPDFSTMAFELIVAYALGIGCFLLIFVLMVLYHRYQVTRGTNHQEGELDLIIRNVKLIRALAIILICCQLPLLIVSDEQTAILTGTSSGQDFFNSIWRPVVSILVCAIALVVNMHVLLRWTYFLSALGLTAIDTIDTFNLFATYACEDADLCPDLQVGRLFGSLQEDIVRNLVALGLEVWSLLICAYLMVSIGLFRSHYPAIALSTSRQFLRHRKLHR